MTYQLYACRSGPGKNALVGYVKEWITQYQDNVIEWEIGSRCWQSDLPIEKPYLVAISVHSHKSVPILTLGVSLIRR